MDETTGELATRLLEAQVAHGLRQLTDDAEFRELAEHEISFFMTESGTIPLETVMPRDLIKAVARKYTMQFPVEGAIPELVGQVAGRVYRHQVHETTDLAEVIPTRRFDELATTAAELHVARRAMDQVLTSPTTADTVVEVVQRAVANRFGGRTARRLARTVDKWTRRGTAFVLDSAREDSDELLIEAMREFWQGRADQRVNGFRDTITEDDVDDVVVLIFEFWRTFRQTEYFRTLLDAGVDEVFDTYAATPVVDVLGDLGITQDDLLEEALRFGPPVIARLEAEGYLSGLLRRRFAPFYSSPEFLAAVDPGR